MKSFTVFHFFLIIINKLIILMLALQILSHQQLSNPNRPEELVGLLYHDC